MLRQPLLDVGWVTLFLVMGWVVMAWAILPTIIIEGVVLFVGIGRQASIRRVLAYSSLANLSSALVGLVVTSILSSQAEAYHAALQVRLGGRPGAWDTTAWQAQFHVILTGLAITWLLSFVVEGLVLTGLHRRAIARIWLCDLIGNLLSYAGIILFAFFRFY